MLDHVYVQVLAGSETTGGDPFLSRTGLGPDS